MISLDGGDDVSTICVSRWVGYLEYVAPLFDPLTQMVLTSSTHLTSLLGDGPGY